MALNDGLLVSYLDSISKDKESLCDNYDKGAFLRDPDCLEMASRFLQGVDKHVYKFNLALNSSILNHWQTPPLVLAGLWVPEKVSGANEPEEACEAIDVVSQIQGDYYRVSFSKLNLLPRFKSKTYINAYIIESHIVDNFYGFVLDL